MKISNSSLAMSAESKETQTLETANTTTIKSALGTTATTIKSTQQSENGNEVDSQAVVLDISDEALESAKQKTRLRAAAASDDNLSDFDAKDNMLIRMLYQMVERATGKKLHFGVMNNIKDSFASGAGKSVSTGGMSAAQVGSVSDSGSVQITSKTTQTYAENQAMSYSAAGIVQTSDGGRIAVSVNMNMSGEFVSHSAASQSWTASTKSVMDPLVINFGAPAAELGSATFSFDLDSDGTSEQISTLGTGSGFLALDIDGNGKIDTGNELFGTKSGDGFADLAEYDGDGNGWIDENDEVYDKLRIWTRDSEGNSRLLALGEKGIGAICLAHAASDFDIKDEDNALNGTVRSTGIFLREDGTAGTIQHVDMAY